MLAHLSAGYLVEIPYKRLAEESLLILGWVANWRPLEIFLYDWWPLAQRRDLYRQLSLAAVEPKSNPIRWNTAPPAQNFVTYDHSVCIMEPHVPTRGLSEADAQERLKAEGPNELPQPDRRTPLRIAIEVLREPMLVLLLVGGVI